MVPMGLGNPSVTTAILKRSKSQNTEWLDYFALCCIILTMSDSSIAKADPYPGSDTRAREPRVVEVFSLVQGGQGVEGDFRPNIERVEHPSQVVESVEIETTGLTFNEWVAATGNDVSNVPLPADVRAREMGLGDDVDEVSNL